MNEADFKSQVVVPDSLYGQFIKVGKVLIQSGINKAGLDPWFNS